MSDTVYANVGRRHAGTNRTVYQESEILADLAGVHGGDSLVMEEILITATLDFEEKKKIARYLAGILE